MSDGLILISRLHRLVRHGYRPWLGYSVDSGEDQTISLRRGGGAVVDIHPDGSVWFTTKVPLVHPRTDPDGTLRHETFAIFANDAENFDALFPANLPFPQRGSFSRWLYQNFY